MYGSVLHMLHVEKSIRMRVQFSAEMFYTRRVQMIFTTSDIYYETIRQGDNPNFQTYNCESFA
jgi:hypothetical protein